MHIFLWIGSFEKKETKSRLYTEEYQQEGNMKINFIEEKKKEKEKLYAKSTVPKQSTSSSGQVQDSSMDKSSDSGPHQSSSAVGEKSSLNESVRSSEDLEGSESEDAKKKKKKNAKKKKELTEEDLNMPGEITLKETKTELIFYVPSATVTPESSIYSQTKKLNEEYLARAQQISKDNSTNRGAQTYNYPPKDMKNIPMDIKNPSVGLECTFYDIIQTEEEERRNPRDPERMIPDMYSPFGFSARSTGNRVFGE